jgi:hypothetical protein
MPLSLEVLLTVGADEEVSLTETMKVFCFYLMMEIVVESSSITEIVDL